MKEGIDKKEAIWASFPQEGEKGKMTDEVKAQSDAYIKTLNMIRGKKHQAVNTPGNIWIKERLEKVSAAEALALAKVLLKNLVGNINAKNERLAGNMHAVNVFIGVATQAKHVNVRLFALKLLAKEVAERVTTCFTQIVVSDRSIQTVEMAKQLLFGRGITANTGIAMGYPPS